MTVNFLNLCHHLKFIKIINRQPINKAIMQYGIDIFMTLTACYNNLKVSQIELGRKIHNPSYNKMENMFLEVLDAAVFTINKNDNYVLKANSKIIENNSFLSTRKFNHKNRAIELNEQYKIDNVDISKEWVDCMQKLLKNIKDGNHIDYSDIQKKFIYRATTFWLNAEKISSNECERLIINQTKNIDRGVRGR